jgi:tetratricopeptide (TPR) repeat protein
MAKQKKKKTPKGKPNKTSQKQVPRSVDEFSTLSLDELKATVQTDPDDVMARLKLAEYCLRNDRENEILEALDGLEDKYPFSDQFLRGFYNRLLAFGHAHRGQFIEAEKAARRGLEEYPNSLDFYFVLAYVHLSLRELEKTISASEKFVSIWNKIVQKQMLPTDFTFTGRHITQLYNMLATAYRDKGEILKAREYYDKSIEADPGNHLPYLNLANLLRQCGEPDHAAGIIKQGLAKCRQVQELRLLSESQQRRATVSACMIVKNEEELLPGCLDSIRDWVDEIIVVDTGSTDRTVEIANSYRAKIFHQPWEGNFSKHRNFSLEQSTCDWIFVIDADERIHRDDIPLIKKVLNQDEYKIISINVFNVSGQNEETVTFLPSIRFFKRELGLKYEGIVHNLLQPPADQPIMRAGVRLKHYGYGLTPEKMKAKIARSKSLLEKQIAGNPDNAFALFNYAQLLRGEGIQEHPENAEKIIQSAGRALELTDPNVASQRHIHIMTHHQLAWVYFVLGQYEKAEQYCLDVLQFKPNYLDALLLLGHIYLRQQIFDKAEEYYHKYINAQAQYNETYEIDNIILLYPHSLPAAYYGLGQVAELKKDLEQAKRYYRQTIHLSSGFLDVNIRLGNIYLVENNYRDAEQCFLRQLEGDGQSHQAALGLANLYFAQKDYDRAEQFYRRALEINPTEAATLIKYGQFLMETGQDSQAVEVLKKAVGDPVLRGKAERYLAEIYFRQGRYIEAADRYKDLLEAEGCQADLLNDLGNCFFKSGNYDQAERFYLQALEASMAPACVYQNLGLAQANQNKIKEAIVAFEKYVELEPERHDIYHVIGDLHAKSGEYSLAITYYEKFLQKAPRSPSALFNLSECYLNMGHRESAIMGYQKVLQWDSSFAPAQRRLDELLKTTSQVR